jgi:hypothetical protein
MSALKGRRFIDSTDTIKNAREVLNIKMAEKSFRKWLPGMFPVPF